MDFSAYQHLVFERRDNGVLLITINRPDRLNATDEVLHNELCRVWPDVSSDPETRVAVITGAGRAFSAGGDLAMVQSQVGNFRKVAGIMKEAGDIVYNIIDCEKPVISAINGVAVGAGLAVAIMADISIMAEDARITDGHIRLGVGAGDHAAIIWPLLCGMAKAKYYLLTADFIDGREAERIGLVSSCVPGDRRAPHRARGRREARHRPPARHPLDQARAQQLAAPGGADLRRVARAGDAELLRRGRRRGRGRHPGEAPAEVPLGALSRRAVSSPRRIRRAARGRPAPQR